MHIFFEQRLAVAPVAEESSRCLVLHARADQRRGEELIARNPDGGEFVPVSGIYRVHHLQILPIARVVLTDLHGGVKVAQCLQMVLNIAPAFVEQIVIHRTFFVDRHQPVQNVLADLEPLRRNLHHRTAIYFEDIIHRVALRLIRAAGRRDLSE